MSGSSFRNILPPGEFSNQIEFRSNTPTSPIRTTPPERLQAISEAARGSIENPFTQMRISSPPLQTVSETEEMVPQETDRKPLLPKALPDNPRTHSPPQREQGSAETGRIVNPFTQMHISTPPLQTVPETEEMVPQETDPKPLLPKAPPNNPRTHSPPQRGQASPESRYYSPVGLPSGILRRDGTLFGVKIRRPSREFSVNAEDRRNLSQHQRNHTIRIDPEDVELRLQKELKAARLQQQKESFVGLQRLEHEERDWNDAVHSESGSYQGTNLIAAACSKRGFSKKTRVNEDRFLCKETQIEIGGNHYSIGLFGVFDGHTGSHEASQWVVDHLEETFLVQLKKFNVREISKIGMYNTLKKTFVYLHEEFIKNSKTKSPVGTTATLTVAIDGSLYFANVGDSRALLRTSPETLQQMTEDQTAGDPKYQRGIQHRGGSVETWKNDIPRINGLLAPGRSIGYNTPGINPRPKITHFQRSKKPVQVILFSDGVSEYFSTNDLKTALQETPLSQNPQVLAKNIGYSARTRTNDKGLILELAEAIRQPNSETKITEIKKAAANLGKCETLPKCVKAIIDQVWKTHRLEDLPQWVIEVAKDLVCHQGEPSRDDVTVLVVSFSGEEIPLDDGRSSE